MRAAVIRAPGGTPILEQFADPQPGPGLSVGTLVAAALLPGRAARSVREHRRRLRRVASGADASRQVRKFIPIRD